MSNTDAPASQVNAVPQATALSQAPALSRTTVASIREELLDNYDEELEMDMDEARLERLTRCTSDDPMGGPGLDRKFISVSCFGFRLNWSSCRIGYRTTS